MLLVWFGGRDLVNVSGAGASRHLFFGTPIPRTLAVPLIFLIAPTCVRVLTPHTPRCPHDATCRLQENRSNVAIKRPGSDRSYGWESRFRLDRLAGLRNGGKSGNLRWCDPGTYQDVSCHPLATTGSRGTVHNRATRCFQTPIRRSDMSYPVV